MNCNVSYVTLNYNNFTSKQTINKTEEPSSSNKLTKFINLELDNGLSIQTITVRLPTDVYGIIPYFQNQILTIGFCMCENGKTVSCNLFAQYRNTTPIELVESNYTLLDYGNNLC